MDRPRTNQRCSQTCSVPQKEADAITKQLRHTPTETLAIIETMEAFAPHLLHRQFTAVTDHESLTKLMTQKNLNRRQQRWLTHISHFDFKIEYQPGAKNFRADYLSRIHEGTPGPLDISPKDPTIDYDSLQLPDPIQPLPINTSSASSSHFGIESDDTIPFPLGTPLEDIQPCPEIRQQGTSSGRYLKCP